MTTIALAPLFFPDVDPTISVISAFLSFAAAFVARPIGAVIFGHFGDRLGRRGALIVTVLLMGLASTLIGALPTYETAGILAPILLTALRVLQGIATGGEWGGATLMAMEYVEPRRKPLMASIVQVGSPIGTLLSTPAGGAAGGWGGGGGVWGGGGGASGCGPGACWAARGGAGCSRPRGGRRRRCGPGRRS